VKFGGQFQISVHKSDVRNVNNSHACNLPRRRIHLSADFKKSYCNNNLTELVACSFFLRRFIDRAQKPRKKRVFD